MESEKNKSYREKLKEIISLKEASNAYLRTIKETLLEEKEHAVEKMRFLYPDEVRAILGISESTYYRLVKAKVLVPRQLGRMRFFFPSDLREAMKISKNKGRI